jgi:hypothetical protein
MVTLLLLLLVVVVVRAAAVVVTGRRVARAMCCGMVCAWGRRWLVLGLVGLLLEVV